MCCQWSRGSRPCSILAFLWGSAWICFLSGSSSGSAEPLPTLPARREPRSTVPNTSCLLHQVSANPIVSLRPGDDVLLGFLGTREKVDALRRACDQVVHIRARKAAETMPLLEAYIG